MRRVAVGRRHKRGFTSIVRKLPLITVSSSGTGGTVYTSDPTTSCLSVGTPTLSTGFVSGVYDIPFSLKFQLSQDTQYSDITSLADQYKIVGAYVRLFYNCNTAIGQNNTSAASMPFVQHVTDHDDAGLPNPSGIRSRMGLKYKILKNDSSYIGMMVRPVPSNEIFAAGAAYGVPGRAPWINSANADVPHYAIKGILNQVPLPDIAEAQTVFTFDVSLKVLAKDFQ